MATRVPFEIGTVGHFGLAVRDPEASARWYERALGMREEFSFDGGIVIGSDNVDLVLFRGEPSPATIDHVSFHLPDTATLRKALAHLKANDVRIEDPGDEIGPEGPGSQNIGIWFYDPDGYRLEFSVLDGAKDSVD